MVFEGLDQPDASFSLSFGRLGGFPTRNSILVRIKIKIIVIVVITTLAKIMIIQATIQERDNLCVSFVRILAYHRSMEAHPCVLGPSSPQLQLV